mmetsp:Transcript_56086/g.114646  ORF Transcript_56086/g.114646 Transcript_56086/m.114646 type:complete len:339 (-) Transcript_56086:32-1048(-)|eukprot:CAMPEP_0181321404 /NCGR_PEP_ID=MMETSP1101-20121128/18662_1 /TAXON_ID=46948 /ORGANISM="Rhodomonas abbreviata, Strain Caron Lab Isolate" /LENGTH=338 /DNA_ID=CAMNT_0023429219 /DNA_START=150 /DNA_END=1166 /DNA_ORIENTATION=+
MSQLIGRIVLVLGGGAAGSELWQKRGDLIQLLQGIYLGGEGFKGWGSSDGGGAPNIDKKFDSLAQEMRSLVASGRNQGTVIISSGGGSSFTRLVFLAVPGAGLYAYARWKGYAIYDLMPVSSTVFTRAVQAMEAAQQSLDTKVEQFRAAAEHAISSFRAQVESRFLEVTDQIDTRVGRVEDRVGDVDQRVEVMQGSLNQVDTRVQRMELKIDETQNQLAYTSRGIHLLCSVVSESVGNTSSNGRQLEDFSRQGPLLTSSYPQPLNQLDAPPVMVDSLPVESLPPLPQVTMGSWTPSTSQAAGSSLGSGSAAGTQVESDNPPGPEDMPAFTTRLASKSV